MNFLILFGETLELSLASSSTFKRCQFYRICCWTVGCGRWGCAFLFLHWQFPGKDGPRVAQASTERHEKLSFSQGQRQSRRNRANGQAAWGTGCKVIEYYKDHRCGFSSLMLQHFMSRPSSSRLSEPSVYGPSMGAPEDRQGGGYDDANDLMANRDQVKIKIPLAPTALYTVRNH